MTKLLLLFSFVVVTVAIAIIINFIVKAKEDEAGNEEEIRFKKIK